MAGAAPAWLPADDPAANLSAEDRTGLAEIQRLVDLAGVALKPILSGALPTIEPTGIGDLFGLLMAGWRLRSLGRRDMPEVMRMLPMTLRDIVEEHVSDPRLQAAIACPAFHGTWPGPWPAGRSSSMSSATSRRWPRWRIRPEGGLAAVALIFFPRMWRRTSGGTTLDCKQSPPTWITAAWRSPRQTAA